jgi:hypothetical protein
MSLSNEDGDRQMTPIEKVENKFAAYRAANDHKFFMDSLGNSFRTEARRDFAEYVHKMRAKYGEFADLQKSMTRDEDAEYRRLHAAKIGT